MEQHFKTPFHCFLVTKRGFSYFLQYFNSLSIFKNVVNPRYVATENSWFCISIALFQIYDYSCMFTLVFS